MPYAYQAALLCDDCAERHMADHANPHEAYREDSNVWPQRCPDNDPSDAPQHCDWCSKFLKNALTNDGYSYVARCIAQWMTSRRGNPVVLRQWAEFYFPGDDT